MLSYKDRLIIWLIRFLEVQCFITLIAWPIMLSWGMPISLLSLLGNLILQPFLIAFLGISSLIFFCALLGIPYGALAWLLQKVSDVWLSVLSLGGGTTYLVYFPQPNWLLFLIIPLSAFLILHTTRRRGYRLLAFLSAILGFGFYLHAQRPAYLWLPIQPKNGQHKIGQYKSGQPKSEQHTSERHTTAQCTYIKAGARNVLIIFGGHFANITSYIRYTLLPTIAKAGGDPHFDTIILSKVTKGGLQLCKELCMQMQIREIYMPALKSMKEYQDAYETLVTCCKERALAIMTIDGPCLLQLGNGHTLDVIPGNKDQLLARSRPYNKVQEKRSP